MREKRANVVLLFGFHVAKIIICPSLKRLRFVVVRSMFHWDGSFKPIESEIEVGRFHFNFQWGLTVLCSPVGEHEPRRGCLIKSDFYSHFCVTLHHIQLCLAGSFEAQIQSDPSKKNKPPQNIQ